MQVEIKDREADKVGIVTTKKGYVYAVSRPLDWDITEDELRAEWRENRRVFRPFDTTRMVYTDI